MALPLRPSQASLRPLRLSPSGLVRQSDPSSVIPLNPPGSVRTTRLCRVAFRDRPKSPGCLSEFSPIVPLTCDALPAYLRALARVLWTSLWRPAFPAFAALTPDPRRAATPDQLALFLKRAYPAGLGDTVLQVPLASRKK